MLITIFETKDFLEWCSKDASNSKVTILDRAFQLLMSVTLRKRDIATYLNCKEILFKNLKYIDIYHEESSDNSSIFNTCLVNQCLTVIYDDEKIQKYCKEAEVSYKMLKTFFNKLSNFITDSAVIEWKVQNHLSYKSVKVSYPRGEHAGFFPISYNTADFIKNIEIISKKKVIFTPEIQHSINITKDSIVCYFSQNRLHSEYIIQQQLCEAYFHYTGFDLVDKHYFLDDSNWKYDKDTLKKAVLLILQNKFSNLISTEMFPAYSDEGIYNCINFQCNDECFAPVIEYLCSYCNNNSLCQGCNGLEDIIGSHRDCPIYKENFVLLRRFSLEELSSPNEHEKLAEQLAEELSSTIN